MPNQKDIFKSINLRSELARAHLMVFLLACTTAALLILGFMQELYAGAIVTIACILLGLVAIWSFAIAIAVKIKK